MIVRIAEDLGGGFSADSEQALRALTETMTEGWVREIGARLGYRPDSVKNLSIYARKLILAHSWPRIRELYQTLVRGVIWTRGEQIEAADIRAAVLPVPTHSRSRSRFDRSVTQGSDLESLVDEVKTHYIRLALKKCGGKKIVAARLLGFSNHQTLGYWIKRLGITSEDLA